MFFRWQVKSSGGSWRVTSKCNLFRHNFYLYAFSFWSQTASFSALLRCLFCFWKHLCKWVLWYLNLFSIPSHKPLHANNSRATFLLSFFHNLAQLTHVRLWPPLNLFPYNFLIQVIHLPLQWVHIKPLFLQTLPRQIKFPFHFGDLDLRLMILLLFIKSLWYQVVKDFFCFRFHLLHQIYSIFVIFT